MAGPGPPAPSPHNSNTGHTHGKLQLTIGVYRKKQQKRHSCCIKKNGNGVPVRLEPWTLYMYSGVTAGKVPRYDNGYLRYGPIYIDLVRIV